jgi:hypothetical protein
MVGNQKKVELQSVQKDGAKSAALFSKTRIPDTNDKMTAIKFLPPNPRALISLVGGGARIACGFPQNGQ